MTPDHEPPGAEEPEVTSPGVRAGPDTLSSFLPRASLVRDAAPVRDRSGVDVRRAAAAAAVVLALVLVVLATTVVGAAGIERAERADRLAQQDLYARVAADSTLLRHPFASERREEMVALFSAVGRVEDPAKRAADAARLVELLTVEARARKQDRPGEPEEAFRRDLDAAVKALRRLEHDVEARGRDVQAARSSIPGRLASLFGA